MKFIKYTTVAVAFISQIAGAVELSSNVTASTFKAKNIQPDFGVFKIERSLMTIPSSIADSQKVVATKGLKSFVEVNQSAGDELIGRGSVVRNMLTDKLSTLTGNIILLLDENASASEVALATNMEVVSIFPGTNIAVFKAADGVDLMTAFNALNQSDLVLESKIEVADNMFESQ